MNVEQYKKFFERIITAEHPATALRDLYYQLMDEEYKHQEIFRILRFIYWQNKRQLEQKEITEAAIREMGDQIEKFHPYKDALCKAVLAQDGGTSMIMEVERLSKEGLSKLEVYYIFLELFSYIQYRELNYHDFQEHHYDLIADYILDGLWGGGWDKGHRLLPDEPDVCDTINKKD